MFEYAQCGWKDRRGKRCNQPAVAIRDLGPAYGKLRLQYVCKQHVAVGHPRPDPSELGQQI